MPDYAWVSFATDDGPLGVVVTAVQPDEAGDSPLAAWLFVNRLHRQGCNPGGEVQWASAPEEHWREHAGEEWPWLLARLDQLIQPLDLVEHGYLMLDDLGPVGRAQVAAQLAELADPDTGIQHADGECDVCDRARTAQRILAKQVARE